ncbi:MAG: hypothetical protein ACJAVN_002502 [Roseivirga sp.]|jgi:hypothetical protein
MITFFRKIRQQLMTENKTSKYMLYAFGEITLVVIGILIALQINNMNDSRKDRNKEVDYLKNVITDLNINITELGSYIDERTACINAAGRILEFYEGKPLTDLNAFNEDAIRIYSWEKFYQNNNTFQELVNSGNLALVSNDTIKNELLNLETLYNKLKGREEHDRFDSENLVYMPAYETMDLNPQIAKHTFVLTNGEAGADVPLSLKAFNSFLKNLKAKNGFVMTTVEFTLMNGQMDEIRTRSEALISMVNREIKR